MTKEGQKEMATQVKKSGGKAEGVKAEGPPESKKFFVIPVNSVARVTAANEREAVREAVNKTGSGKYIVVEADYTEVFSTSQRIELKAETTDSLFTE